MKVIMSLALAICCSSAVVFGGEKEALVLRSSAQALDALVSQKTVAYKEVVKPGLKPERTPVPPVDLARIAPVVSKRLKLSEPQVLALLKDDKTKLSQIVIARFLEESGGKPWNELLEKNQSDDLIRMVEERGITTRVKNTLDELYTEVSFAALDAMERPAKGAAPAGSKGEAKESSNIKVTK